MPRVLFWLGCFVIVVGVLFALDADRGALMAVIAGLLAGVLGRNEARIVERWERRRRTGAAPRAD